MKDVKELDDGNPHIVTVAFHTFFKEQGETKLLVITQAVKSGVDCHACGVLVGFSIFKYRRTTNVSYFDLEYLNPYMGFSGQWGKISPSITLMKHRTLDHFAIRFRDCYMNQGYSSCSEWTTDLRSSEFTHSNLKGFEGPKPEVSGDSPEFKKWTTFQTEFLAGK
jgi:hypothetical protein